MKMSPFTVREIRQLLAPSSLSLFLSIVLPLLYMVVSVFIFHYSGNYLSQEVFAFHNATAGVDISYQTITTNLSQNRIIGDAPLYIFWGGVGFIVYLFAVRIVSVFSNAVYFEEELTYINSKRRTLIKQAILHVIIRLITLVIWIVLLLLTIHRLLPYSVIKARDLALHLSMNTVDHAIYAALLLFLDVMVQAVLFRLLALRPRVF
jgi:hypothetical protein